MKLTQQQLRAVVKEELSRAKRKQNEAVIKGAAYYDGDARDICNSTDIHDASDNLAETIVEALAEFVDGDFLDIDAMHPEVVNDVRAAVHAIVAKYLEDSVESER